MLVEGKTSRRQITAKYGIPGSTLKRYEESYLIKGIAKYQGGKEFKRIKSVREQIEGILDDLFDLLKRAKESTEGGGWATLGCYREIRGYLEMLRKIEIEDGMREKDVFTPEEVAVIMERVIRKIPKSKAEIEAIFGAIGKNGKGNR